MGCNKCNQNNNCGCTQKYVSHHICNECPPQQPCDCPVKDLSTDCILYTQDDIICNDVVVVEQNTILSDTLNSIVSWACQKFSDLQNYLRLINVGTGAEIYAGNNLIGEKKLRKLNSGSDILTITQNTNDITFDIDEEELNDFIEANQKTYSIDNVGTGAEIYKTPDDIVGDNTEFNLRTLKVTPTGEGISIIDSVDTITLPDEINIKLKTFVSDSLSITEEGTTEIRIETPPDINIKQFYVNENYTGVETGSILKPYKKLTSALVAAIGSGDITTPEFEGANIILQTNVTVTQADLTASPVLQDKLSVNTLTVKSENGDKKVISFFGTTDYPIDTEFLFNEVGVDGSLNLNRNIVIVFDGVEVYSEAVKGLVKSKSYNNGVIDITKPNCELLFNNGIINANYKPLGAYVLAKDSLNNNITAFGNNIFVQDSIVNDTPHVIAFGKGTNGEGAFICNNTTIIGTSQTHFKLLDTTFTSESLNVVSNTINLSTDDTTPVTPGVYLPKTDVFKIHAENAYCRIIKYEDGNDYPNNITDGGVYVGGTNSYFKCENPLLFAQAAFTINEGFIYSGYTNYLLETDKDYAQRYLLNCDFKNLVTEIGAFDYIGAVVGNKTIDIEGSNILNVEDPLTTNIEVTAVSAIVNGFDYSSTTSFVDDVAALAAGLIPGNIYYNTTTNSLKRVV